MFAGKMGLELADPYIKSTRLSIYYMSVESHIIDNRQGKGYKS